MNIKEYINKKADVIFVAIAVLAVAVFIVMAWHALNEVRQMFVYMNNVNNISNARDGGKEESNIATSTEWRCLGENEIVEYEVEEKGIIGGTVTINMKSKGGLDSFQIKNIFNKFYFVELYDCGIYVIKLFNYDINKIKQGPNSRKELWRYDYSGMGEQLILLNMKDQIGNYISYYNSDFRVDPLERYIVLERGYLYKEDYALIVKDLETKEDVFVLLHSDLPKENLKLIGIFDFREWTRDGRYFWGEISAGAVVPGFFRIDTETWEYELFADLPEWIGGGDQLNVETGWVTYHTDMVWTGVHQMTEEIKQERREQGIGTTLYIYNLFTKEKRLIYKTEEPIWFTKPTWLSDTELEYELPSGEKKVYELK